MAATKSPAVRKRQGFFQKRSRNWQLYLMILLPFIHLLIFRYGPMYGLLMAFTNFNPIQGIWGSEWVGFHHFRRFFDSFMFDRVMRNTLDGKLGIH